MITPDLNVTTIISPYSGFLNYPTGIDIDSNGNIYVADTSNNLIRIITPEYNIKTISGFKEPGYINGASSDARFYYPTGIKIHTDGSLLVSDQYNSLIRKITIEVMEHDLILDNKIVPQTNVDVSFNYADIAMTFRPIYSTTEPVVISSQNLRVSNSSEVSGQLGPTLSRAPGTIQPFIQGHQRGRR
jgi:hypothetical protein